MLPEAPPARSWTEPDGHDSDDEPRRRDTLPAPPPSVASSPSAIHQGLDLTVTPGIVRAIQSAERLSAAGQHWEALDDLRRAFALLRAELARIDSRSDYERAHQDWRIVEIPPPREVANLSYSQVERGEHQRIVEELAGGKVTRLLSCVPVRRVKDGPGWSFRGNAGGGVQVFEHTKQACDVLERIAL